MALPPVCRLHYRPAVAACLDCGGGLCDECLAAADPEAVRCRFCAKAQVAAKEADEVRQHSRLALRRAGVGIGREPGDPVILRRGPLRLALPTIGLPVLVLATGVLFAEVELRSGVDATIAAVAVAVVLGLAVRLLFGGVSRIAGLCAALACLAAIGAGRWLAGNERPGPGGAFDGVRRAIDQVPGSWLPVVAGAVAGLLAYVAGAGHRPV